MNIQPTLKAISLFFFMGSLSYPVVAMENTMNEEKNATFMQPEYGEKAKEHSLFLQTAPSASIERSKEHPDTYTVTLRGVSDSVTSFSERPFRHASTISIKTLLNLWQLEGKDAFKENPPNAAIHVHQLNGSNRESQSYIVVLTNPVYDKENHTLSYTTKTVEGSPAKMPDSAKAQYITIFIDDICLKCFRP